MEYLLLFLEGMITFISPCLLPMLPVYLSYFSTAENKKPLANAMGFVVGFTIVFVALGAFAGVAGRFVIQHQGIINIVAGSFIIFLGLRYMGIIRITLPRLIKTRHTAPKVTGPVSSVLFGVVFALTWTPCVGAFLASAILRASLQGSVVQGMLMLFVFAMGLGVPLVASAVLVNRLTGVFDFIKRNYKVINIISGGVLIVVGLLIATGVFGRYMALFF